MTTEPLVLVIDDEVSICRAVSSFLRRRGFSVETHLGALGVVAGGRWQSARLIVSDLSMPECDGIELALRLRQQGYEGPFVFITGLGRSVVTPFEEALKPCSVVEKPFYNRDLEAVVTSYIQPSKP